MIHGDRVRLRALNKNDLPLFVTWLNDPEVTQGLLHYLPFSLEDEEDWYENIRKRPREERPLMIEIQPKDHWESIGNLSLFDIDWRIRSAEFGILIGAKQHWNQGYGTEALNLTLNHGFQTLNLNRIHLKVFEDNARAIQAYKKAGFVQEGRLRQGHYKDGQFVDVILMSILRSEWDLLEKYMEIGGDHAR